MGDFTGFSGTGLQFLADLAENNNREWFQANKAIYETEWVAPALAFVAALGERLRFIAPGIQYDLRKNGAGSLMRIYRDVRFSQDKRPYKTHVGMVLWEGSAKKTENPGFYVGLDASGGGLHVGIHGFSKPMLTAYRAAVTDATLGPALTAAVAAVNAAGPYEFGGEHYKRVPRGFDADHPRAEWLRYASLWASAPAFSPAQLMRADFVDLCLDHCQRMAPVHQWLVRVARTM